MKLITEIINENTVIVEKTGDVKKTYIEGIFMQGDIKNRNGRIYPSTMLENKVNDYVNSHIITNRALGELGHPIGPTVNADRASHLITKLYKEGNDFIGKALILEELPSGKIVKGLLDAGVKLGVSSRGMGSIIENRNGIKEVQNDFFLATIDIVTDPSAPDAFVNGIFENVEWIWDNGILKATKLAEEAKVEVEQAVVSRSLDEAAKLAIFEKYMKSLI